MDTPLTRRTFLRTTALATGGLVVAFVVPHAHRYASAQPDTAADAPPFAPNAFLRIGSDDTVTVLIAHSEMGQGIWRSEEHTSELQSQSNLVCRLLLEKKKNHPTRHSPLCRRATHRHAPVTGLR